MTPVSADAVAVSGETRNTRSSFVPDLSGKFRGVVRSELVSLAGACPIPMQPLQPAWCSRAPPLTRWARSPEAMSSESTARAEGLMSNETSGCACVPLSRTMRAATAKSRKPGFADDPM